MPASFLDSNIILYSLSNDPERQDIALTLLARNPTVSVQVLSETANVMRKKLGFDLATLGTVIDRIAQECSHIQPLTLATLQTGFRLSGRYGFSHYDSLIVAAALEVGCARLYSEDMHHGQVIDGRLTIINPFL